MWSHHVPLGLASASPAPLLHIRAYTRMHHPQQENHLCCKRLHLHNQSRENGWNKEQYPAVTFLDFHRVLFVPAVCICLLHRLSLMAWAEGSGTIQLLTVQPAAGERLLLLGNPLLSLLVSLPRYRVRFERPQDCFKKSLGWVCGQSQWRGMFLTLSCDWCDEMLYKRSMLAVPKRGQGGQLLGNKDLTVQWTTALNISWSSQSQWKHSLWLWYAWGLPLSS